MRERYEKKTNSPSGVGDDGGETCGDTCGGANRVVDALQYRLEPLTTRHDTTQNVCCLSEHNAERNRCRH